MRVGLLCLLTTLLLAGCRLQPLAAVIPSAPEKDVLHYRVDLAEPWTPEQYYQWSREDLAERPVEGHRRPDPTVPVYEVFYSFYQGKTKLASVHYRREDEPRGAVTGADALKHLRTLVFPEPQVQP